MTDATPCGCCEPTSGLTPLTVVNRAGLSAIAYRVGTYASFRGDDARGDRAAPPSSPG